VPATIPAWKDKSALREVGLLDAVEVAVAATGGRFHDGWVGASEWSLDGAFKLTLASVLGLTKVDIDRLDRVAAGVRS
jgi:hypothetical protein